MIDSIDYTSNYMSENSDKEEDKGGASGNYLKDLMEKQRTLFISEEVSPKPTKKNRSGSEPFLQTPNQDLRF